MSRKPENTFRASVHKYFDLAKLHHEKMSNPYRAGGADDWYSGKPQAHRAMTGAVTRDLWVEWKFIVVPVRDDTMIDLVSGKKPPLTALQQHWLRERYNEGRNVAVGIGSAGGGVLLWNLKWEMSIPAKEFRNSTVSRAVLAKQITDFVQGASR